MQNIRFVLFTFILMAGCASQKQQTDNTPAPPPDWIQAKPSSGLYYHGIGYGLKAAHPTDFQNVAKKNALNDLASEISVQISSTSMLYQMERDERLYQEFRSNTRIKSLENIEGFELVDTYENAREYWVYYRLNKAEYETLKRQRQERAKQQAYDLYKRGQEFRSNLNYYQAFKINIQALEAIRDYLGEPLRIEENGTFVFLGNKIHSAILEMLSEIKMEPFIPEVSVKRGFPLTRDEARFIVNGPGGAPLQGMPVYFFYSGGRLQEQTAFTDSRGIAATFIPKINSTYSSEYLQANINLVQIVKESTEDPIISAIIGKYSTPEARLPITVVRPTVYLTSNERNLGEPTMQNTLKAVLESELIKMGMQIANEPLQADYVIEIISDTRDLGIVNRFYSAALDATVNIRNNNNELIHTEQLNNVRGVRMSAKEAGLDAYQRAAEQIRNYLILNLKRKVFE